MKYIILSEDKAKEIMGMVSGVNMIMPVRILSGPNIGKYACSEGSVGDFPEVFEKFEPLEIAEIFQGEFAKNTEIVNLSGYGVEIPLQFQWVFDQDKFVLNEFEIPLVTRSEKKYVDVSYFNWPEFRHELDLKDEKGQFIFAALKRSLMPLWDYVAEQILNNNLIEL